MPGFMFFKNKSGYDFDHFAVKDILKKHSILMHLFLVSSTVLFFGRRHALFQNGLTYFFLRRVPLPNVIEHLLEWHILKTVWWHNKDHSIFKPYFDNHFLNCPSFSMATKLS